MLIRWWELETSESGAMLWKGDQSPRVKKGKKACVARKVGECFQWEAHGQCSKGDLCSFSRDIQAFGNSGKDEKDDRLLLHPIRRQNRLTARDINPHRDQAVNRGNSSDKSEIPCRFKFCKDPSCKFWHLPVCLKYKSEKGCVHGDKCHFRHVEAEGKPNKKSKKGGAKGSVAILKESIKLGCVSQDSYPRKSILRESGKLGSKHTVKFSKGTWHQMKIRERKGPSRCIIQKCASHERGLCSPKFEERSHEETLHQERCARKATWDLAKNIYKLKNSDKTMFLCSWWSQGNAGAHFKETRGARIRSWFRSIGAHGEQERIKLRRDGQSKEVQKPYSSVDC